MRSEIRTMLLSCEFSYLMVSFPKSLAASHAHELGMAEEGSLSGQQGYSQFLAAIWAAPESFC
mgnify:CR=1 FL=1